MSLLSRADQGPLSRWFWTVDRWLVGLVLLLVSLGLILNLAGSQAIGKRLFDNPYHFFERQVLFALVGLAILFGCAMLSRQAVKRMAAILLPISFLLIGLTLAIGPEIKGAHRWLPLGSFALQPSEFMKPLFIVVTAWVLSSKYDDPTVPAMQVSTLLVLVALCLLVAQPDFGQTALVLVVWLTQMFLAGLSMVWVVSAVALGVVGILTAYLTVPHVAERINVFLDPATGDDYQIRTAERAFENGGLFGVGPGQGDVKAVLPDAHTDFIFAVAGEEFGVLACIVLALLYLAIIVRVLKQELDEEDPFVFLAASGLIVQFGAQAFINIGVNIKMLPSKGMTLPFVSYGGSSFLALALGMGMVLALTRRNRFLRGSASGQQGWV